MAWQITADKAGTVTALTEGKFLDRNIEFEVPAGSAKVVSKTITKNPTVTWDSTNKKIKATYSGSDTVDGSATAGWVTSVTGATVSTSGTTNVDPATLDASLVSGNIKSGTSIFGVSGSLTGASFGTTTATRNGNTVSWGTGWITEGSSTGDVTSRTKGEGSVSATPTGLDLGTPVTSAPSSGKYIKVDGSGTVSTGTGWITSGSTTSNTDTKYYPVDTASFTNAATNGKTYTDISSSAPVLVSGDYLYVNKGYFDTDSKISLAKLVPDAATLVGSAAAYLYKDYTAYDKDGTLITGTMNDATLTASATGSATISSATYEYNSSSGKFNVTGSAAISGTASAGVGNVGYAKNGLTGSGSTTGTVNLSTTVNKVSLGTTKTSGNLTVAPTLARTAKPSSDTWTDAASGAVTTTKPTSGVYVQIDAAAATNTLKVKPTVSSAGYGDTSNYGFTEYSVSVGAAKATTAYVPITNSAGTASSGAANATGTGVALGTKTTTAPTSGKYIKVDGSGKYNVTTAGWITSGEKTGGSATAYYPIATSSQTNSCTATASKVNPKATYSTSVAISDSENYNSTGVLTTAPTTTGAVYITISPTISKTNGSAKADASASCSVTVGYADADTKTATATQKSVDVGIDDTKGTTRYIQVYTGEFSVA